MMCLPPCGGVKGAKREQVEVQSGVGVLRG